MVITMSSETSKCRERLSKYCIGNGIDVGYGGDPIVPHAITIDSRDRYAQVGVHPQNLTGDAKSLYWFNSGVLDFVFSSHLLEDFSEEEQIPVLTEWMRVLAPNGNLIIYCPVEKVYRQHCKDTGQVYNLHHKIIDFSLDYVLSRLHSTNIGYTVIHSNGLIDTYSFELVVKKT